MSKANVFIADTAKLIGNVVLGERVSIWFGAVLRADIASIEIGELSNVQDNVVIHVDKDIPTIIGKGVTIGHGAIIHACRIDDFTLVGMGAILLDNCVIGDHSIIAAGTVITPGKEIPPGVLVMGVPGKVVRNLTEDEKKSLEEHAAKYWELAKSYLMR
ncbi:MAG: gamma carbonic anhydrase family protein [Synergistetes bacterium]|nr:gamma carbonic anhydrase family protein [Synergistota bacterium]MCX8127998.1 gamma carbonic anhydrase family protein [Synergistota bacterium]MDW8192807.1 gamma carbonic anhydrase family protein [Synergistota bacterium]